MAPFHPEYEKLKIKLSQMRKRNPPQWGCCCTKPNPKTKEGDSRKARKGENASRHECERVKEREKREKSRKKTEEEDCGE